MGHCADCYFSQEVGHCPYFQQEAGYESLINLRPNLGNRSMEIQDPAIREQIDRIVQNLLGNVQWQ